jgi:hypothetical protein
MLMCEFLTAVHHKLPVKMVIYNNSAFGLIPLEAEAAGLPPFRQGIELPNPDFAALARACSGHGFAARSPGELKAAVSEAVDIDGPGIVDSAAPSMTDANPLDAASSNCVGEWIQGVADQCEYMLYPDLLEHPHQQSATVCDTCRADGLRRHVLCGQAY